MIGLGVFDKILGIIFGVLRAAILIALLYLPVFQLTDPEQRDEWFPNSYSRPYVEAMTAWSLQFLPKASEEDIETAKENAGKAVSKMGEKIKDMTDTADKESETKENGDKPAENDFDGYQDEQRESLDRLFEDNVNE